MNSLREGLSEIHTAGIAHRDIKPENIMIDPDTLVPTYIDFGLACLGEACDTNKVGGSFPYMAPEIIYGLTHPVRYNLKSLQEADIWSLGMTEFYLVTGSDYWNLWFTQTHPEANYNQDFTRLVAEEILSPQPLPLERLLPEEVIRDYPQIYIALQQALQKDPEKRQMLVV